MHPPPDDDAAAAAAAAEAERLLIAGSFVRAASAALQLLRSPHPPPAHLAERCQVVLCQVALHQKDPGLLEAAVQLAGGLHSLTCRALLLLSLAHLRLDRADTVEAQVPQYLAHPAVAAALSDPERVAIHRLMALELYCRTRCDYAAAYAWLHKASADLPPERLAPVYAAVDDLQAAARSTAGNAPGRPPAAPPAPPAGPDSSPFFTMTGAGLAPGSPPHRSSQAAAAFQYGPRLLLQRSWWAERPVGALRALWQWMQAPGGGALGVGWGAPRWAEVLVGAAVVYALVSEWKWLRAVLGSLARRVGEGGTALRGALWDAVLMALALSPNPASQLPVGVRS